MKDVSQLLWESFQSAKPPVIAIGLFPHEHKMSVLNTVLKRTQNFKAPIKSKERLIFQCGYRRFIVNPIFSTHTNGQKHKVSISWWCIFLSIVVTLIFVDSSNGSFNLTLQQWLHFMPLFSFHQHQYCVIRKFLENQFL